MLSIAANVRQRVEIVEGRDSSGNATRTRRIVMEGDHRAAVPLIVARGQNLNAQGDQEVELPGLRVFNEEKVSAAGPGQAGGSERLALGLPAGPGSATDVALQARGARSGRALFNAFRDALEGPQGGGGIMVNYRVTGDDETGARRAAAGVGRVLPWCQRQRFGGDDPGCARARGGA